MRMTFLEKWNPFVKGVTILVLCLMLALTSSWKINLLVFAADICMILFLSKGSVKSLLTLLIPVCFLAAAVFVSGLMHGKGQAVSGSLYQVADLDSALLLSTRILGYVSLGLLFALTTDPEEFVLALVHQAHVKPKFAFGVLAAYHLIPTLRREWDEVGLAYRARQKNPGLIPVGPLFNTLVNGIRWSENVAMAMESKGFDGSPERTYRTRTTVSVKDIIFALILLALMAVIMVCFR